MAWTDPTERATGFLVTAAVYNADIIDNLTFLHTGISIRVNQTADTSIATDTDTAIIFNNTRWSVGDVPTLSSSELTVAVAGKYLIGGSIEWEPSNVGERDVSIRLNGTTVVAQQSQVSASATALEQDLETVYDLAVNDVVELIVRQASGGALNVTATSNRSPELWMNWLSA